MRVYVAGASSEREHRAKPAIQRLREAGIEITHDWTVHVDECAAAGLSEGDLPIDEQRECARRDLFGIQDARYVLLLVPVEPSFGASVELGYALNDGTAVIASGAPDQKSIFLSYAHRRFDLDDEAIEWLVAKHKDLTEAA